MKEDSDWRNGREDQYGLGQKADVIIVHTRGSLPLVNNLKLGHD